MDAQLDLGQRAFGIYSAGQRAQWSYVAGLRARQGLFLGAFAGGRPAGAAMIHDLRQWWLGRAVPCAGIASVKVAPEYRGARHRPPPDDRAAGRGRGARLPAVGAVPRDDADLPVARLGAGGRASTRRPSRPARCARCSPPTPPVPARTASRPPRSAGPARTTPPRSSPSSAAPTRPPATRAAHLGRGPDQAVAGPPGPVLLPGRRRRLRRLPVGRRRPRQAVRGAGARRGTRNRCARSGR